MASLSNSEWFSSHRWQHWSTDARNSCSSSRRCTAQWGHTQVLLVTAIQSLSLFGVRWWLRRADNESLRWRQQWMPPCQANQYPATRDTYCKRRLPNGLAAGHQTNAYLEIYMHTYIHYLWGSSTVRAKCTQEYCKVLSIKVHDCSSVCVC